MFSSTSFPYHSLPFWLRKPLHELSKVSKQCVACHRNEEDWTWLGIVGFSSLNWLRFSSISQWEIEVRQFCCRAGIKRANSNIAVSLGNENFSRFWFSSGCGAEGRDFVGFTCPRGNKSLSKDDLLWRSLSLCAWLSQLYVDLSFERLRNIDCDET